MLFELALVALEPVRQLLAELVVDAQVLEDAVDERRSQLLLVAAEVRLRVQRVDAPREEEEAGARDGRRRRRGGARSGRSAGLFDGVGKPLE